MRARPVLKPYRMKSEKVPLAASIGHGVKGNDAMARVRRWQDRNLLKVCDRAKMLYERERPAGSAFAVTPRDRTRSAKTLSPRAAVRTAKHQRDPRSFRTFTGKARIW